jgi:hypothetical protein
MEGGELRSSKKGEEVEFGSHAMQTSSIMDGDGAGGVEDRADRDFER